MQEQTLQLEHQAKLKVGEGGRWGAVEKTQAERTWERTQAVGARWVLGVGGWTGWGDR